MPIHLPPKKTLLSAGFSNALSAKLHNHPFGQRETGDWLDEKLNLDDRVGIDTVALYPGVEFDAFDDDISYRWVKDARDWINKPRTQPSAAKSLLRMQLFYLAFYKLGDPLSWPGTNGGEDE